MTRADRARLVDVVTAVEAIRDHLARGELDDGLIYDAVRVRLIEIGEAVKDIHGAARDRAERPVAGHRSHA